MISYIAGFGALLLLAFAFLWRKGQEWMRSSLVLAALAILVTFAYLELGAWRELRINELQLATMTPDEGTPEQRDELVKLLLEAADDDSRYAYLLGHRLLLNRDYLAARDEFASLRAQGTDDFNVDLSFVQSDFLAREGLLGESARELAWKHIESNNPVLLEILVLDSLRSGDQAAFLEVWPKYSATPRGASFAQSLGQPQRATGLPKLAATGDGNELRGARVQVELSASAGLDVPANTSVFVLAREVNAAGPPLAVRRLMFSDLPFILVLSDSDAMLESRRLSDFEEVEVVARIAFSGGPIAAEGDLEVSSGVLELGAEPVSIRLQLK